MSDDVKRILDLLDITVEDIVDHCGVTTRTAYRWASGETAAKGADRTNWITLIAERIEDQERQCTTPGTVTHIIRVSDLVVVHAEPYLHPLFKVSTIGQCLLDDYVYDNGDRSQVEESTRQLFNVVIAGTPLCLEHCSTHKGVHRLSYAWFYPMPDKKHIKYVETWYDQFVLPVRPNTAP